MFKSRMGSRLYVCFKSEHLGKLKGSAVIFVGPTQCLVEVDNNKKKFVEVEKRPIPENSQTIETKRMKAALDKSAEENIKFEKDLLELRRNPQLGILQQMVAHLQSQNANLEAERREKMKEAIAMKSLLEGQGHGSGDELDELVKAAVMSLEEEEDGAGEKMKKTKRDAGKEEDAREAIEKKVEEEDEVAASSVKEGVEEEPKEGAEEARMKAFLDGLSALMKNMK